MKKIILICLAFVLFVGCSTSSLRLLDSGSLELNYNADSYLLTKKVLKRDSLNFKDLYIDRFKLEDKNGGVLFYENAHTALDFEFNFGGLYTVLYIFDDAQHYEMLCRRNNLRMLQVELKDGNYVNVLLQASDTQVYSYVYGFSNKEFLNIFNAIKKKDDKKIVLKHKAITFDKNSNNITNWNDKLVYFTPLITPLRTMGRF